MDYAGDGVPVVDRLTGEIRNAQIFVAVLGASGFTYAQATWTQGLADWISGHVGAFEAIGGVPALVVPDNAETAVIKACFYDPQINRSYAEMAGHNGTAILPARPRRPRDKAKVEQAVLVIERWLIVGLRHRVFHTLADLNAAIRAMLHRLNDERPIRRLGVTRRQLFDEIDRPALKALPAAPCVFAEWRVRRVSLDYHVDVADHYYSVSHRFVRAGRGAAYRAHGGDLPQGRARIAAHQRMSGNHKHTTVPEHMAPPVGFTPAEPSSASARMPRRSGLRRCGTVQSYPRRATVSRAGLPGLSRHHQASMAANGSKPPPRVRSTSARALPLGQINSRQQPRSSSCTRDCDRPSQHPRAALLQLGEQTC
ncbi:IS21 family transposase [Bradyrhizobium sp. USDA 3397]